MEFPIWLKPALWGAAAGAVALAFVGFQQLGWVTKKSAREMAQDQAESAVIAAVVPFCIAKAKADPDRAGFLKIQAEPSGYTRSEAVSKAGWASFVSGKEPDSNIARACADQIHAMGPV